MADEERITVSKSDLRLALLGLWTEEEDQPRNDAILRLRAQVSEGVGHSQTDRAPSDVLHADTSLSDPIIAGGNVTQWPESSVR